MGLSIKNNQLKGTLKCASNWRVKLSINPSKEPGFFFLTATFLINEVYQSNVCKYYKHDKKNKGYKYATQELFIDAEKEFGVDLLSSNLKVAS